MHHYIQPVIFVLKIVESLVKLYHYSYVFEYYIVIKFGTVARVH